MNIAGSYPSCFLVFSCLCVCLLERKHQNHEGKQHKEQNTNGKHAECDHVKKKTANQKSSEAESLNILK
jgi:hypothetical protein